MKILYYKRKDNYSFGRVYVTGKASASVRSLTGRETLTPKDQDALKALGHTLMEVSEPQQ